MGYYMDQKDQNFFIDKSNITHVVNAIHALAKETSNMSGVKIDNKNVVSQHYSWVSNNYVDSNDIKEIFKCWRWHVDTDDQGNIESIYFEGQKLGDDEYLFKAIAPFVKDDSYIEMSGEDGALWRWAFKNGQCREVYATITWDY